MKKIGSEKIISRRKLFAYSAPAFALAIPTIPAYIYLPTVYANSIGLTATGLILLGARFIDVISDPIIGIVSDNKITPWGRRKPWILIGSIISGFAILMLFQPPQQASISYLLIWAIFLYIGWTMVAVPYTAWGAELSNDYHQRSRITGTRESLTLLGILFAGAIPAISSKFGMLENESLTVIAWTAVIIGLPSMIILLLFVKDHQINNKNTLSYSNSINSIKTLKNNPPFLRLVSSWFINGLANGIPATLFLLYMEFALEIEQSRRSILILSYFLSGVISIPLWIQLSKTYGKHRVWCYSMIITCIAFFFVLFLSPGDFVYFTLICLITGTGLGADLALPPALQADVIDFDKLINKQNRAGLCFAIWSMSSKLALALAVGIAFPLLEIMGFSTTNENNVFAIQSLIVIYAGIPIVLKVLAISMIWSFPITKNRQELIQKRLAKQQMS